jgi:hypothetical protein
MSIWPSHPTHHENIIQLYPIPAHILGYENTPRRGFLTLCIMSRCSYLPGSTVARWTPDEHGTKLGGSSALISHHSAPSSLYPWEEAHSRRTPMITISVNERRTPGFKKEYSMGYDTVANQLTAGKHSSLRFARIVFFDLLQSICLSLTSTWISASKILSLVDLRVTMFVSSLSCHTCEWH